MEALNFTPDLSLIPGADVAWVDRLDSDNTQHQNAPPTHQAETSNDTEMPELNENIGGDGRTRTDDLGIMRTQQGTATF